MGAYEAMVSALSPLGIYSLTDDSNISKELRAYSEGLDILMNELDIALRECFFSTAQTYGLSKPERLWGTERSDLPIEKRREMLLARSSFSYDDFTPEGIDKLLKMLGVSGRVIEYPQIHRIVVDVSQGDYTQGQRNWILSQLYALLPAHLEVDAVFDGFKWKDIEARGLTFQEMDNRSLTWQEIDSLI